MTCVKATALVLVGTAAGAWFVHSGAVDVEGDKMLGHVVYFTMKDGSKANIEKCVQSCKKYLAKHEGTVFFAVGVRNAVLEREVNDKDFHICLHLVFKNKAAHDKYQDHPEHKKFIDECKDLWAKVRVFDDDVIQVSFPSTKD